MDGLKQGGLAQGIIELPFMVDHFKVEAHPSWW